MQVLDRYLAAIARHLPKAQAADITAELRENLLSEIEEREAELGRKLDARELDQLLIGFGHPLAVAARYRKARYLIGPEIHPFWMATLKVVLGVYAAIVVIGLLIAALSGQAPAARLGPALGQAWSSVFTVFGVVTLIFAVMERAWNGRMQLHWSPRQLAPPARRAPGRKPAQVVSEMAMGGLFLLWWTGFVQFHALVPIPPFVHLHLAHVWAGFYGIILAYAAVEIAIGALELVRPGCARLNGGLSAAKNVAGCIIFWQVLQAGHWIDVNAAVPPHALASMRHGFDRGMQIGLQATVLVLAIKAIIDAWRVIRGGAAKGGHAGSMAAA
jgi:hypothetical protein